MSKPSGTNSPNDFLYRGPFSHPRIVKYSKEGVWVKRTLRYHVVSYNNVDLGGYSSGVPPLPIPNREVKPVHADGPAVTCGRVGSRLLRVLRAIGGLFFYAAKGLNQGAIGDRYYLSVFEGYSYNGRFVSFERKMVWGSECCTESRACRFPIAEFISANKQIL